MSDNETVQHALAELSEALQRQESELAKGFRDLSGDFDIVIGRLSDLAGELEALKSATQGATGSASASSGATEEKRKAESGKRRAHREGEAPAEPQSKAHREGEAPAEPQPPIRHSPSAIRHSQGEAPAEPQAESGKRKAESGGQFPSIAGGQRPPEQPRATGSASALTGATAGQNSITASSASPGASGLQVSPSNDLESLLFGPELSADGSLADARGELIRGVRCGDPASLSFAGTLLAFRGADVEHMAPLLKDIGEAYYRWRPRAARSADPFRDELIGWLQRTCHEAGVANTIELVQPGDRFESRRHNATGRGVEVTDVHGWLVLRAGGSVYTKATVSVQ